MARDTSSVGHDQTPPSYHSPAPIKRPEDLKGKKLGSDRYGSLSDVVLRDVLRHFHLVPDRDVAIIQAGEMKVIGRQVRVFPALTLDFIL